MTTLRGNRVSFLVKWFTTNQAVIWLRKFFLVVSLSHSRGGFKTEVRIKRLVRDISLANVVKFNDVWHEIHAYEMNQHKNILTTRPRLCLSVLIYLKFYWKFQQKYSSKHSINEFMNCAANIATRLVVRHDHDLKRVIVKIKWEKKLFLSRKKSNFFLAFE